MKSNRSCLGVVLVLAGCLLAAAPAWAQNKHDKDKDSGDKLEKEGKGFSLKEARRQALENNYDLMQAKRQLMEKAITRAKYDATAAKVMADLEEAYMGLYVAREELRIAQQRAARTAGEKGSPRKAEAKPAASPEVAETEKIIAQARRLGEFIPLEQQVKLQELQLKALMNSKAYSVRTDTEIVPMDRPVAMKKDLDENALIEAAFDQADRGAAAAKGRGGHADRGGHPDRSPMAMDNEKKKIVLSVKRAVLKAQASVKRLEIARQVKDLQQKRLDLLRAAKADPAEIEVAADSVEEAGLAELRAIVANNGDLMDIAELTGTLLKDLDVDSGG